MVMVMVVVSCVLMCRWMMMVVWGGNRMIISLSVLLL